MLNQTEIAVHLDMSVRNVRDVLKSLADKHGLAHDWWKSTTLDDVRVKYIRDQREKAAGRGGSDQVNLTKQRAEESQVKTAMMRLEYQEKIGALVPADAVGPVVREWCLLANREYGAGISKLVSEIQSTYKIVVDKKLVDNIAGTALKRIQDHASSVGESLVEGGESFYSTGDAANSEVAI